MKKWLPLIIAILATIPGFTLRFMNIDFEHNVVPFPPYVIALVTTIAIFSASFILTWACEVLQLDIPQALAILLIALIAVLPEYAVDMYFTWMAGQHPESEYVHYAIANMTGANRLLIGIGWSAVILLFVYKFKQKIVLENTYKSEIFFLMIATAFALTIPLKGHLNLIDTVVLFGIFVWYILIAIKKPVADEEVEGPAKAIANLPKAQRRIVTWGLIFIAGIVIFADAELFSESLVKTGTMFGVNEFLLVQWLAPIASEAPEFIIALTFAIRGSAGMALGALISSKLNQWTLLVGMIPLVYTVSYTTADHEHATTFFNTVMPLASIQMHELLLTAAQSAFAIALIVGLIVGKKEAFFLLTLFLLQFASPLYQDYIPSIKAMDHHDFILLSFSVIYIVLTVVLIIKNFSKFVSVIKGYRTIE